MPAFRLRAAAAALAVALCACASQQRETYTALRSRLEPPPRPAASDPLAGVTRLDRARLVALALERNPGIDAARAAARAALARWPQDTALPDPTFGYGLRPRSLHSDEVDPAHDFELSQPLPFPGKRALRGERALAEAEAAASDFDRERLRLTALAARLLAEYWVAERALTSAAAQAALLDDARRVGLARYAAGEGERADLLAVETESAMLAHREIELRAERRIVVERINTLLHRDVAEPLPPPPDELLPTVTREVDDRALIERAVAARPELRARAEEVRAREADVALARREFLPDFALRAAYEGSWQEDPLKPFVGVELNLPLQLGRRNAALEEAEARLTRAKSRERRARDQVRLEVASAAERVRESRHLLHVASERLLPAARDRAAAVRAGYASGGATFLALAEAERALRAAEQAELGARAGVSIRDAELALALGETEEASHD